MSHKLCRQVSIESPSARSNVFTFDVPIPDVPKEGARVKVICAGVCYRRRDSTISSDVIRGGAGSCQGFRDAALFPGYEVSGVIDELGPDVDPNCDFRVGDKVIVYPDELIPHGYAEYTVVPELNDLVKVPDNVPMPVAAMLPTGALWAMNAVHAAKAHVDTFQKDAGPEKKVKILIVGTGGLALWAIRFAKHSFLEEHFNVEIVAAVLKDEGLSMAEEGESIKVVHWSEDLYEKQLIERTRLECKGDVDIVIDFGTTVRTLLRSLQCLAKGGVVLIGTETSNILIRKFSKQIESNSQTIQAIEIGSQEQLKELMDLVSTGKIIPPPYEVFPAEQASNVMKKVVRSELKGRAILQFGELE